MFWALQRPAALVAPKDVQLMTRRDDLELSHGATAKVRENAVKQGRVRITNAIGHHPERPGFLRRTEFIGGTGGQDGDLRPFGAAEVAAMSAATSPGTGLAYGLRRVCAAWGMARSSFYAMTSGQHAEQPPAKRRGPWAMLSFMIRAAARLTSASPQ